MLSLMCHADMKLGMGHLETSILSKVDISVPEHTINSSLAALGVVYHLMGRHTSTSAPSLTCSLRPRRWTQSTTTWRSRLRSRAGHSPCSLLPSCTLMCLALPSTPQSLHGGCGAMCTSTQTVSRALQLCVSNCAVSMQSLPSGTRSWQARVLTIVRGLCRPHLQEEAAGWWR